MKHDINFELWEFILLFLGQKKQNNDIDLLPFTIAFHLLLVGQRTAPMFSTIKPSSHCEK